MKINKIILITNIIAPYRVPLFNQISKIKYIDLEVLFCQVKTKDRLWNIPLDMRFNYKILKGFRCQLKRKSMYAKRTVHINPGLIFHLLKKNPDVIISAEYSLPTFLAFSYCKLFKKRFISWSEGTPFTERNITLFQKILRKLIIHNCDAYVAASQDAKKYFLSFGVDYNRVFIGIQTLDIKEFKRRCEKARKNKDTLRDLRGWKENIILYSGSVIERKGIIHLLKAFKLLTERNKDVRLLIVGDGKEYKKYKIYCKINNIEEKVYFSGFIQQNELPFYYASADIYLFPSLEDTFAVTVNEAMAAGLPIVCSKFAGCANDLIENGVNGYIIDPYDHGSIVRYLERILSDSKLRENMGKASFNIIDRFDIDKAADGFFKAIKTAVGG